jgi:DNA repair protein RadB
VVLCKQFLEGIGWPRTLPLVYGESGTGKTTLALEFVREFCRGSRCLYVSTNIQGLIERARSMLVSLESLTLLEALDYLDFIRVVEVRELPLYELIVVDTINEFLREPSEPSVRATTFLAAMLRRLLEEYGVPSILNAIVSGGEEGEERPTGVKLLQPWVTVYVKLERVEGRRVARIEPKGESFEFEIVEDGVRWLTC